MNHGSSEEGRRCQAPRRSSALPGAAEFAPARLPAGWAASAARRLTRFRSHTDLACVLLQNGDMASTVILLEEAHPVYVRFRMFCFSTVPCAPYMYGSVCSVSVRFRMFRICTGPYQRTGWEGAQRGRGPSPPYAPWGRKGPLRGPWDPPGPFKDPWCLTCSSEAWPKAEGSKNLYPPWTHPIFTPGAPDLWGGLGARRLWPY